MSTWLNYFLHESYDSQQPVAAHPENPIIESVDPNVGIARTRNI